MPLARHDVSVRRRRADLDARVVERPVDRGVGLADADRDRIDREVGQELVAIASARASRSRKLVDSTIGRHDLEDDPVVDGLRRGRRRPRPAGGRAPARRRRGTAGPPAARARGRRDGPGTPCRGAGSDRSWGLPQSGSRAAPRTMASVMRAARTLACDVVDPDDVDAGGDAERGRGQRRLEPLVGRQVEDPPRVDLRDVPRRIGRPSTRELAQVAQEPRFWSGVLPKPNPGSTISDSRATPSRDGPLDRPLEVGDDLGARGPCSAARRGCA